MTDSLCHSLKECMQSTRLLQLLTPLEIWSQLTLVLSNSSLQSISLLDLLVLVVDFQSNGILWTCSKFSHYSATWTHKILDTSTGSSFIPTFSSLSHKFLHLMISTKSKDWLMMKATSIVSHLSNRTSGSMQLRDLRIQRTPSPSKEWRWWRIPSLRPMLSQLKVNQHLSFTHRLSLIF